MKLKRMRTRWNSLKGGVALDLVCLGGVISVLGALLLPVWQRSMLREKAAVLRGDLALIEQAVAEAAIERDVDAAEALSFDDYRAYLGGRDELKHKGLDPFGEPYGDQYVDEVPVVPLAAYEQLRSVVPDSFWEPYQLPRRGVK